MAMVARRASAPAVLYARIRTHTHTRAPAYSRDQRFMYTFLHENKSSAVMNFLRFRSGVLVVVLLHLVFFYYCFFCSVAPTRLCAICVCVCVRSFTQSVSRCSTLCTRRGAVVSMCKCYTAINGKMKKTRRKRRPAIEPYKFVSIWYERRTASTPFSCIRHQT